MKNGLKYAGILKLPGLPMLNMVRAFTKKRESIDQVCTITKPVLQYQISSNSQTCSCLRNLV